MEQRTVDGQSVIFIPKMYFNNQTLTSGKYAGKPDYMISEKGGSGWHLAPIFYNHGVEVENGIEIATDPASKGSDGKAQSIAGASPWVNISYNDIRAAGKTRNTGTAGTEQYGWHAENIYEYQLRARLMLLEYGAADLQNLIGGSSTAMDVTYHGIKKAWGGASWGQWIDGLTTTGSGNTIMIFDNRGNETMVDTHITPPGSGWAVDFHREKGDSYDLGDVFIASSVDSTESNGSCGDYQWLYGGYAVNSYWSANADCGPFCLGNASLTITYSYLGFRLARFC